MYTHQEWGVSHACLIVLGMCQRKPHQMDLEHDYLRDYLLRFVFELIFVMRSAFVYRPWLQSPFNDAQTESQALDLWTASTEERSYVAL